jgi:hypothetical protein
LIVWIVAAIAAAFLRLKGAQKRFDPRLAMAALLALVGYWGALSVVHRLAAADAGSMAEHVVAPRGEHLIRAAAMPTAASARRWQAVAETDQAMYRFVIQLGSTNGPQAADGSMTRYPKPNGPAQALVKMGEADRRARTLLDFARFPIAHVDADNCVGQTLVQFADLRYTEPGRERGNFSVNIPVDCPAR